jgi:hypothetical protein
MADERRAAMMSVYYHSLGRQLELRGAPAVLLPPAVRPMPLEAALEQIGGESEDARREALWTMLRSVPPPPPDRPDLTRELRYPPALRSFAQKYFATDKQTDWVKEYDERRAKYRRRSAVFGSALAVYCQGCMPAFEALKTAHRDLGDVTAGAFDPTCEALRPQDYLDGLAVGDVYERKPCVDDLLRLEEEVGMGLQTFVNDLADATAFMESWPRRPAADDKFVAYPTAAVVVQDTRTLTIRVTATSLVRAESLSEITTVLDPRNWWKWSDAFRRVRYVEETGQKLTPARNLPPAGTSTQNAKLFEEVEIMSGLSPTPIANFENVLSVDLDVNKPGTEADLTFELWRSIRSRYLWDERPGGILLDEGFTRVRPVYPTGNAGVDGNGKVWRVTARKTLRFADRTPASWGDTPLQFGQSLNYLAPAALAWWLQSDIYNAARYASQERVNGQR